MAEDLLMLQAFPLTETIRFRHYGWDQDCYTFGYGQPIKTVYPWVHKKPCSLLVRRPTGGGVVDHSDDWTFALVLPSSHPLYRQRAIMSYRRIHEAVVTALREQQCPSILVSYSLEPKGSNLPRRPGVCFMRPERYDVIHGKTQQKIAGAAQKRNLSGLLVQGSIAKQATGPLNWDRFGSTFKVQLAAALNAHLTPIDPPSYPSEVAQEMQQRFASKAWNYRR